MNYLHQFQLSLEKLNLMCELYYAYISYKMLRKYNHKKRKNNARPLQELS